uniref:Uncharacterized protein n=1 Tax=viral metagenome TaxID=1070528 RepID=A0A6C0I169_9ZZZZ
MSIFDFTPFNILNGDYGIKIIKKCKCIIFEYHY